MASSKEKTYRVPFSKSEGYLINFLKVIEKEENPIFQLGLHIERIQQGNQLDVNDFNSQLDELKKTIPDISGKKIRVIIEELL